jgi:hypothetical protein
MSDLREGSTDLEYNVASGYPLKRGWFPTFEFNGRRENSQNRFYLTPGLWRRFSRRVEMGIGVPLDERGVGRSVGVVAKMNWVRLFWNGAIIVLNQAAAWRRN